MTQNDLILALALSADQKEEPTYIPPEEIEEQMAEDHKGG